LTSRRRGQKKFAFAHFLDTVRSCGKANRAAGFTYRESLLIICIAYIIAGGKKGFGSEAAERRGKRYIMLKYNDKIFKKVTADVPRPAPETPGLPGR
jgi:hypothetical protein